MGTLTLFLLVAVLGRGGFAGPQELPSAERILDRYVEVTGGREAYDKIQNRVTDGVLQLDNGQVQIPLKTYRAKPGKVFSRQEVPQLGTIEKGATADVAWEINPSTGTNVYEGRERGAFLRQAVFDRIVYWRNAWKKAECAGTKMVDGQKCFELVMTPKAFDESELEEKNAPPPDRLYFSEETGLLVMASQTFISPGSSGVTVETRPTVLRRVDGILLPFRTIQQVADQPPMVTELHTIQQNIILMPRQFALPDEVMKIVEQRRKKKN